MKCLQTSDWHADANLDEFKKCSTFLLATAKEENPDLIIIAGDIFNSRDIKLESETCKLVFEKIHILSEIAPVSIVTGTPTHEGTATESLIYTSAFEHNVTVSSMPEQLFLVNGELKREVWTEEEGYKIEPDAIISTMPTPTKKWMQGTNDEIAQALTPIFAGFGAGASDYKCPHILIGHFSVRGASISDTQIMVGRDIEISKDQLALGNFDLVCLGHIHKAQQIDNIFYAGSLFANNFGEKEDKGFYIHNINKPKGTLEPSFNKWDIQSRFIKTPAKKLVTVRANLTKENFDPIIDESVKGASIKIELSMFQDDKFSINLDEIKKQYLDAGATEVKLITAHIPRENVRSESIMKLSTLPDKIEEGAKIKEESIPEGVLDIAHDFETLPEKEIYGKVTSGDYDRPGPGVSAS